jgi:tetratricopeptide (TPR) repeat protein
MIPWARRGTVIVAALFGLAACAAGNNAPQAADPRAETEIVAAAAPSPLGSYLAARHAQQTHDYANAAVMMEHALADDPTNLDLMRRTFALRVTDGRVGDAVPLAQALVARENNASLAAMVLLVEDMKNEDWDAAQQRVGKLPREGAQRFAVPLLAAWVAAARNAPERALASLGEMGNLRGLEPLRDLHQALLNDYLQRPDAAGAAYKRLIGEEQNPTWRVVEVAGNFYERQGDTQAAQQLYDRFAAQDFDTDAVASGLARLAKGEKPAPLIASPRQGAAQALFDIASLLNQRDTIDAALIYTRLALELDPKFALAQLLAGEIRAEESRTADALALYSAVDPNSALGWSARLRVALALDALDRTDEAIAELKTMAAQRPTRPEPLIEEGDIYRGHNKFDDAARAYDAALARLPTVDKRAWRLYYDRGVVLERSGQWPRAEADLKRALELQPDQPMVLNYLGYSWIDKGQNLSEAMRMIQRAVELRPNDGYIVDSLGWAFYRIGDFRHATQFLEHAIELLPEDPTINDHLGDVYWQTGRLAEARFQWHRALQFKPEADEVKIIETKLDRGLTKRPQAMSGG